MILVLAGTGEARELAAMMAREGIAAEASLAGVTGRPEALDLPTRVGGFGGDVGFRAYLAGRHVRAVVDATHPFAAGISQRTARVCHELGIAYCLLRRPAWQAGSGDRWHAVSGAGDVAAIIPERARVFLAVGRQEAAAFAALAGREVVLRSIEMAEGLPVGWENVIARPSSVVADEVALFRAKAIDWVVSKNSGGAGAAAKLAAARELGLPVAMIARPEVPVGAHVVESANAALDWVRAL